MNRQAAKDAKLEPEEGPRPGLQESLFFPVPLRPLCLGGSIHPPAAAWRLHGALLAALIFGACNSPAKDKALEPSAPTEVANHAGFDRAWACTGGAYASPFAAGTTELTPTPLAGVPTDFTDNLEGVVWTGDRLLFSHIKYDAANGNPAEIYEFKDGKTQVFISNSGSNGLAMHPDGSLIAATHGNRNLTRFDLKTKQGTTVVKSLDGEADPGFNSPNDVAIRSDGVIYFTDPNWQKWGDGTTVTGNRLYVVKPDGSATTVQTPFAAAQGGPNGVVLSLDAQTLYVGGNGWTTDPAPLAAYAVNSDGSLQSYTKWPPSDGTAHGVDGMTLDCAGNLYVTDGDVWVYSPAGELLGKVLIGGGVTNVAFGGTDGKTLFISKQNPARILSIRMPLPGLAY
jgi:gluconolactonase